MRLATVALTVGLASGAGGFAQAPSARPAQEVDTLVSPEVHADRRVTFRLRAPKAAEVTLRGDWMPGQAREKLVKDEQGVWSVTVGPLQPDTYSYSLSLDGVAILDPRNPRVKLGVRSSTTSVLEVPGAPPLPHEVRDVAHGAVQVNWYKSSTLGAIRRFYVYTPPGYEKKKSTRYPALYLLHGAGDTEGEWTWFGCANLILDNLLAEGKAKPMLVVMPLGHAAPAGDMRPAARGQNTKLFEEDLLKDVMPAVASKYRLAAGPKNRAIAGLSMGGAQALSVGLGHLELFGAIGVFSAGSGDDFETRYQALLAAPEATNKKLGLFWIGCGAQDFLLQGAKRLDESLTRHNIKHVFRLSEGAHTWLVWRRYLAEFAPLLFQSGKR